MAYSYLFIVTLLIPYPTVQHFIWPLHWCLLADICNHTYIPECGTENALDIFNRRLFIDECDMFEYNCDYEADYYPINYSSCFNIPPTPCPTKPPCPSIPTCPDHRYHNVTNLILVSKKYKPKSSKKPQYKTTTSSKTPQSTTTESTTESTTPSTTTNDPRLPPGWLDSRFTTTPKNPLPRWNKGRVLRRYSPPFRKKKRKTTRQLTKASTVRKTIKKTSPTTTRTKILKTMTVKKNGRVFLKIFKAIIRDNPKKKKVRDSEFLE